MTKDDSVAKESMSNLSTSCSGATFFLSEKILLPLWLADTQMTRLKTHLAELAFSSSLSNIDCFVVRHTVSGLDTVDSLWIARTCSSTALLDGYLAIIQKVIAEISGCISLFRLHILFINCWAVLCIHITPVQGSKLGFFSWTDLFLTVFYFLSNEGLFLVEGKIETHPGISKSWL